MASSGSFSSCFVVFVLFVVNEILQETSGAEGGAEAMRCPDANPMGSPGQVLAYELSRIVRFQHVPAGVCKHTPYGLAAAKWAAASWAVRARL